MTEYFMLFICVFIVCASMYAHVYMCLCMYTIVYMHSTEQRTTC